MIASPNSTNSIDYLQAQFVLPSSSATSVSTSFSPLICLLRKLALSHSSDLVKQHWLYNPSKPKRYTIFGSSILPLPLPAHTSAITMTASTESHTMFSYPSTESLEMNAETTKRTESVEVMNKTNHAVMISRPCDSQTKYLDPSVRQTAIVSRQRL